MAPVVVPDRHALDAVAQRKVDRAVAQMEAITHAELRAGRPNPMVLLQGRPAVGAWQPLTKRSIALHVIYNPDLGRLGEGIDSRCYEMPIFTDPDGGLPRSAAVPGRRCGPAG